MDCSMPGSLSCTISQSLFKLMSIELVILSNHRILSRCLLLLPSIFPGIRVFSNESALLIRWSEFWSFSISPSNKHSGLISFRVWFPCCPRDSQESPALQFKSNNFLVLSLFYGPILTSTRDYWKSHSFPLAVLRTLGQMLKSNFGPQWNLRQVQHDRWYQNSKFEYSIPIQEYLKHSWNTIKC